jgi:hypothetical protein
MFPWSPEFVWDAGHVAFFGTLYSVLAAIAVTLAVAGRRALQDAREDGGAAVAWQADFEELPASARACRHRLTGEAPGRVCQNRFDCRRCAEHPRLAALREQGGAADGSCPDGVPEEASLGLELPLDRFYHRGHTWARLERDGTVSVGLDGLALRLVGGAAQVALPPLGSRLALNGQAARVRTRAGEVRILSPLEGTVVAHEGAGARFALRLAPAGPVDTRHLLRGGEARAWALRELERLQLSLGASGERPVLADGGELVADVGATLPRERYDALLGQMLLEP